MFVVGVIVRADGKFQPPFTYAMMSTDRGVTWKEVGERLPGKFQSLSFRNHAFGIVAYEFYEENGAGRQSYAMTIRRIDQTFQTIRIDTLDSLESYKYTCYPSADYTQVRLVLVDSATILISRVTSCSRDPEYNAGGPGNLWYNRDQSLSTDAGTSFTSVDGSKVESEASRSYIRPNTPEVLADGIWTGVFWRMTLDSGKTWVYHACPLVDSGQADTVGISHLNFVEGRPNETLFLRIREDAARREIVLRFAEADVRNCVMTWDQETHRIGADWGYLDVKVLPYNNATKMLVTMSSSLGINVVVRTRRLLIYDRQSSVSVQSDSGSMLDNCVVNYHNNELTIRVNHTIRLPYTLRVVDLLGSVVIEKTVTTQNATVNTHALTLGVYVVALYDKDGNLASTIVNIASDY